MSDLLNGILPEDDSSLLTLLEATPLPMWIFDQKTLQFLAVNQAAVATYGYSREEFLRRTVLDIRPQQEVRKFLQTAFRRPHASVDPEYWVHLRKDNTLIEVEIHSAETSYEGHRAEVVCAIPQASSDEQSPHWKQLRALPDSQLDLR